MEISTEPSRRRVAERVVPAAIVAAGAALIVLVGHDGSPGWQVVRVVVVVAVGCGVGWASRRDHPAARPVVAAFGMSATAVGVGMSGHAVGHGPTVRGVAGLVLVAAGLALVVGATARMVGGRRLAVRVAGGVGALVLTALVVWTVSPAVAVNNVAATSVGATPADLGLSYQSTTVVTADGVPLAAWYLPTRNGAAVVLRHGAGSTRSDVLPQAEVLAAAGFGVLAVDARGHGDSGGRAMDLGWYGDRDVAAAVRHLATRPDVEPGRIGLVGMSMGGEEVIGVADDHLPVRAVVAEGATARTAADKDWLSEEYGVRGWFQEQLERLQYGLIDLLTAARPPAALRRSIADSGDTRFLLVTAGTVADEAHAAEHMASAAPGRVDVWTVDGAEHTDGLSTAPEEWTTRVVGFLRQNL